MTTPTSVAVNLGHGIQVACMDPDGAVRVMTVDPPATDPLAVIREQIDPACRAAELVALGDPDDVHGLDMWVDEDGLDGRFVANRYASVLARLLGAPVGVIFGPVVLTGRAPDPEGGHTLGTVPAPVMSHLAALGLVID